MNDHCICKAKSEKQSNGNWDWNATSEQYAELSRILNDVYAGLDKAKAFAEEHNLKFYFGPTRAMGGDFIGNKEVFDDYASGNYNANAGWCPSSGSC